MNSVLISPTIEPLIPQCGDVYEREGMFYVLAQIGLEYSCVNIADGHIWDLPINNIEAAIEGLTFVGRNAEISIKFPK